MRLLNTFAPLAVLLGVAAPSPDVRAPAPKAAAETVQDTAIQGTWTLTLRAGEAPHLNFQWGTSNWGNSVELAELRGLADAQARSAAPAPVAFRLEREAGTFEMEGVFREGRGTGFFRFRPNRAFRGTLAALGVRGTERIGDRELMVLALSRASSANVRELASLLGALSSQQVVELSIHGITPAYVREVRSLGISGADTPAGVVELRIHRISAAYVRELAELGYRDLSRGMLLQMGIHGVGARQVRELRELGYRDLTPQQLVMLRIHGITPAHIRHMREGGFTDLTPEALVELKIHNVTPEYVRELAALGYRDLPRSTLMQMGIHRVTPAFIRQLRSEGHGDLSPQALIERRIFGADGRPGRGGRRRGS